MIITNISNLNDTIIFRDSPKHLLRYLIGYITKSIRQVTKISGTT